MPMMAMGFMGFMILAVKCLWWMNAADTLDVWTMTARPSSTIITDTTTRTLGLPPARLSRTGLAALDRQRERVPLEIHLDLDPTKGRTSQVMHRIAARDVGMRCACRR